ncbi:hypothetical protein OIV83_005517 [Microbotryomycetes sp. JL201]|nr:hypothetical protein OIV83_005517 [Microbotryomycetes sp. JL201]
MAFSTRPEVALIVPAGDAAAAAGTHQQLPPGIGVHAFVNDNEGLRATAEAKSTCGAWTNVVSEPARPDFRHELRHDVESAVYVLLKVLWFHLRPQMSKAELDFWSTEIHFDDANVDARRIRTARESLWGGITGEVLCEHLTRASPELGRLIGSLLEHRLKVTSSISEEDLVRRLWVLLDCADQLALDEELKNKWAKH